MVSRPAGRRAAAVGLFPDLPTVPSVRLRPGALTSPPTPLFFTLEQRPEGAGARRPPAPVVAVNVWYHVGSRRRAPGPHRLRAPLRAHDVQGSTHVAAGRTSTVILERAGGTNNGTTNTDRTNYYETLPANELELALWLEADRMGFLLDDARPGEARQPARRGEERAAPELRERALRPACVEIIVRARCTRRTTRITRHHRLDGGPRRRDAWTTCGASSAATTCPTTPRWSSPAT